MRLRSNFVSGTLDNNPLSATGTIMVSEDIDLPQLDAGYDYYAIILDPQEINGDLEVVYVTEHADGATPADTATIVRGKEGTTQRIHPVDTYWVHTPTKLDGVHHLYEHAIDYPKHTPDTPDDDFDGVALDAKWTVTDGTEGSVTSLISVPTQDKFEVNGGGFISQTSNSNIQQIYQAYTLPIGNSIVAKFYPNTNTTDGNGPDSGAGQVRFCLTDNTTSPTTNNFVEAIFYVSGTDDTLMGSITNGAWDGYYQGVGDKGWKPTIPMYIRIARIDTLVYVVSYSFDGVTWSHCPTSTAVAAYTHIWFSFENTENDISTPVFIESCSWIRQYDNDLVFF